MDKDEVGKMEGRVLTGNMTFYTGDMKNAFKLPVKYPILPKADIKSEKEVKAKKDTTIAALQRNQAVTWVKNGDGDVEFFNSQKELYPTHVPLYHVRKPLDVFLDINKFSGASAACCQECKGRQSSKWRRIGWFSEINFG